MAGEELYLVVPPQKGLVKGFPFGLNAIRNYLEQSHADGDAFRTCVRIIDLSDAPENLAGAQDSIESRLSAIPNNALVGITAVTASYQPALRIARIVKAKGNRVIMGGPHPAKQAEVILKSHDYVDYVALGEGEKTLLELLRNGAERASGLAYRSGSRVAMNRKKSLSSEELSSVLLDIDRSLLSSKPSGKLETELGKAFPYTSSRGCTQRCSFCAAKGSYASKDPEAIVRDIRQIRELGFGRISFEDNFFGADAQKAGQLLELLTRMNNESKSRLVWDCQTRVDISEERGFLRKMRYAGCDTVFLGMENLDSGILKYLNKARDPEKYIEKARKTVDECYKVGINPMIMFQIGTEPEDSNARRNNLKLLGKFGIEALKNRRELDTYLMLSVAYPGTRLFEDYIKRNRLGKTIMEDFTSWEYNSRGDGRYRFIRQNFPHGLGGIPIGIMDAEKMKAGIFEMDLEKFEEVSSYYEAIKRLPGIRVNSIKDYVG